MRLRARLFRDYTASNPLTGSPVNLWFWDQPTLLGTTPSRLYGATKEIIAHNIVDAISDDSDIPIGTIRTLTSSLCGRGIPDDSTLRSYIHAIPVTIYHRQHDISLIPLTRTGQTFHGYAWVSTLGLRRSKPNSTWHSRTYQEVLDGLAVNVYRYDAFVNREEYCLQIERLEYATDSTRPEWIAYGTYTTHESVLDSAVDTVLGVMHSIVPNVQFGKWAEFDFEPSN